MIFPNLLTALLVLLSISVNQIEGHGGLANPPQRGSLYRFPEYGWANPPQTPNDDYLACGRRMVTDPLNGACGLCGDSILDTRPRRHEIGGQYDRGVITGNYSIGQTLDVEINVPISHLGYWVFRLCPYSRTGAESEECFNQYPLQFEDGSSRFENIDSSAGSRFNRIRLPTGLTCDRCVLQWDWNGEANGEFYRNCADISIR